MNTNPTATERLVFAIQILANAGSENPHASDEDLYRIISDSLAKIPYIDVDIVWGPHTQQMPNGKSFNTMYVAQICGTQQYIVAVSGTNSQSLFDWVFQDFNVAVTTPWIFNPEVSDAKISGATALGLALLNMMIPKGSVPGSGIALLRFLRDIAKSPCEITVSGHSKGGALAPTMALMLCDLQGKPLLWDPNKNAVVKTMGTAGPTAGNSEFAAYSNSVLPNGDLSQNQSVSVRFANSLDIVPHAWNEQSLEQIKTIYGSEIHSTIINGLIDFAKELASRTSYTQIAPSNPPFAGQLDSSKIDPDKSNFSNFLVQAAHQHIEAYFEYFQIPQQAQQALQHLIMTPAISKQLKDTVENMGEKVSTDIVVLDDQHTLPLLGDIRKAKREDIAKQLIAEMEKLTQPIEG
ncbi:lipase family protein (plasmid) [Pseudoalteromonas sp. T1lg65]|uniref:lipase family protein n=1 Tax=Pseudoalteromonas sp. T1lg65 TaxID=2077101 RepID=UPI003F7906A4